MKRNEKKNKWTLLWGQFFNSENDHKCGNSNDTETLTLILQNKRTVVICSYETCML